MFYNFFALISIDSNAKPGKKSLIKQVSKEKAKTSIIPLLLEIKLNGTLLPGVTQCYKDSSGQIWVEESDLRNWGMKLNSYVPINYCEEYLYKLDWYPGLDYQLDQYTMQLTLSAPPELFVIQTFDPLSINV